VDQNLELSFTRESPNIDQQIVLTDNQGLRSPNMKYCVYVQNNTVMFFDGSRNKQLIPVIVQF